MAQYIIQQIKEQRQTYDKNHIRSFVDIYIKEENEQTGIKNQHDSKCLTLELYFRNKYIMDNVPLSYRNGQSLK